MNRYSISPFPSAAINLVSQVLLSCFVFFSFILLKIRKNSKQLVGPR